LVLSRSVYVGDANKVTPGQTLLSGCVTQIVLVPLIGGGLGAFTTLRAAPSGEVLRGISFAPGQ
jgi:hypothetical protein